MYELIRDSEFDLLMYNPEETPYEALEEDIVEHGLKEPILVWGSVIIDGRRRYRICSERSIPIKVRHIHFKHQYEAVHYICKMQLMRPDIPEKMHRYIVGKYFEASKKIYLALTPGYVEYNETTGRSLQNTDYSLEIAEKIGSETHHTAATVINSEKFALSVDAVAHIDARLAACILNGKLKISEKNLLELSALPTKDAYAIGNIVSDCDSEKISYFQVRNMYFNNQSKAQSLKSQADAHGPIQIKEVPKYDPDAEIVSLAFTIPSWVSSINRTCTKADFSKTTSTARKKLLKEIRALNDAADQIRKLLEEPNV